MIFLTASKRSSTLAMAIALATGTVVTAMAVETPAFAQKKDKEEKEAKAEYSKEFVKTYGEVAEVYNNPETQPAELVAQVPALRESISTADDKQRGGNLILNIGVKANDDALKLEGIDLQIESGKLTGAELGAQYFNAQQITSAAGNYDRARTYLTALAEQDLPTQVTMSDGTARTYRRDDYLLSIFESHVTEGNYDAALAYMDGLVNARVAANEKANEQWIRRAMSVAQEASNDQAVADYAYRFVSMYPSDLAWRDAVAVTYNSSPLDSPGMLDLLRLARRVNALQNASMYNEYVESANPRTLAQEVVNVIDEGYSAGALDRSDTWIAEQRTEAAGRIEADLADFPALGRDARASSANSTLVVRAADAFLSYDRPAEAEEFYTKALTMSGVDQPRLLTRLGIAQLDQGKYTQAEQTFAKVEGARKTLAMLWALYATQQAGG